MSELGINVSEVFNDEGYLESNKLESELFYLVNDITLINKTYISEENVKAGNTIDLEYRDLRYGDRNEYDYFVEQYTGERSIEDAYEDPRIMEAFKEAYPDKVKYAENRLIVSEIKDYNRLLDRISKHKGVQYHFSNEESTFSNVNYVRRDFSSRDVYFIFDGDGEYSEPFSNNYYYNRDSLQLDEDVLYITFTDEYLKNQEAIWNDKVSNMNIYLISLGIILAAFLISLYILWTNVDDKNYRLISGKWYFEFILIVSSTLIGIFTAFVVEVQSANMVYFGIKLLIIGIVIISFLIQVKKHFIIYRGLSHSMTYVIIKYISTKIGNLFRKFPVMVRMFPSFNKCTDFKETFLYLEHIKSGDFDYNVEKKSSGLYGDLITSIDQIKEGMKVAVYNELKSERMKSELITNVSHDIRTPLTSIITYIDLLNGEDDISKQKEYLSVLNSKTGRLNSLIEDLFDAAKISSGNIPINLEEVDLKSLLMQLLGEYDEKINDRGLNFVNQLEEVVISADRNAMWRVVDNLFSNVIKYAQTNSRVYVEVKEDNANVSLIMKNISEHPLNITSDELKMRFKRGEASRTSSGSGLGLAITEDLIRLQNGIFNVHVDGDLFKVEIIFPKIEKIKE